jgi:hypothetical protein
VSARRIDLRGFLRALTIGPVERRLLIVSLIVGAVVWPVVYTLKELVHWLFHEILHLIEESPTPLVIFVPLLIGAAITALVAQKPRWTIPFRRLTIPEAMADRSLEELDLNERFGVSDIGVYPKDSTEDAENLHAIEPETLLEPGDTLALTGSATALDALNQAVNTAMEG